MKFQLSFNLKSCVLPIDYRRCILSFIKHCLSNANGGKYFADFYGPAKEKAFCFSTIFDQPNYTSDHIEVTSPKMSIVFSSPDTRTGFILYSAFAAQKGKSYPLPMENRMTLTRITQLKEDVVRGNKLLVKMSEPLCIRSHNPETNKDWYYSCKAGDQFMSECQRVISYELQRAGFSESLSQVSMTPINARSIVVKHYGINIECSIGDFELTGNSAALDYLLKAGIGSRRSSGFGVAKIIAQEEV